MGSVQVETSTDPKVHFDHVRTLLHEVERLVRAEFLRVDDPKAQTLFETTAEVVCGLIKAYDRAESRSDTAPR
jgi:hypothetical protein